jgi:hypothetical protein
MIPHARQTNWSRMYFRPSMPSHIRSFEIVPSYWHGNHAALAVAAAVGAMIFTLWVVILA